MKSNLSDICSFVKDKIEVSCLDKQTYISTENMLPNKRGITLASSLPKTKKTQKFQKGDVLVSNIRPYFKKIWFADFDGGCSNDVLVLRAKEGTSSRFLYYVLANNDFFDYSTATSKGTKMPRGDKVAIMNYQVPQLALITQEKIADLLQVFDDKIKLNNQLNENLIQQAQALYNFYFVDFGPFEGIMPTNWICSNLGSIASIKTDSFSPKKNPNIMLEHYSIPAFDATHYPVFELSECVKSNKYILTPDSVMVSKLNPETKRVWRPDCLTKNSVCSTEFIVYEANNTQHKDFLYSIINSESFNQYLCSHTTGSTNSRQRVIPSETLKFPITLADDETIESFCNLVSPIYDHIAANIRENQHLATIRETLLPQLMTGELDVSDIDI